MLLNKSLTLPYLFPYLVILSIPTCTGISRHSWILDSSVSFYIWSHKVLFLDLPLLSQFSIFLAYGSLRTIQQVPTFDALVGFFSFYYCQNNEPLVSTYMTHVITIRGRSTYKRNDRRRRRGRMKISTFAKFRSEWLSLASSSPPHKWPPLTRALSLSQGKGKKG